MDYKRLLSFYSDCDKVLRKHLEFQNKIDSSPINYSNPTFVEICEQMLKRYDIEYFRAIHYELKSNDLIIIATNHSQVDQAFYRNVLTEKGFHFAKTNSFLKNYLKIHTKSKRNEIFIILGIIAAFISAIYSALTYYKEIPIKSTIKKNYIESQKKLQLPKLKSSVILKDSIKN